MCLGGLYMYLQAKLFEQEESNMVVARNLITYTLNVSVDEEL
jgi:hypothetical protein